MESLRRQLRPVFKATQISRQVTRVADEIIAHYEQVLIDDERLVLLGVLKGCVPFLSGLMTRLDKKAPFGCELEFAMASSYGDGFEPGELTVDLYAKALVDRHVLIVDDTIDGGGTMAVTEARVIEQGPASVKSAVLVDKTARRTCEIDPDFAAITLDEDLFLIGCGLDHQQVLRGLPYIGVMGDDYE